MFNGYQGQAGVEEGPRRKKWTGNKRGMKLKPTSLPVSNGNQTELRSSTLQFLWIWWNRGASVFLGVLSLSLLILHNNTSLGSCQVIQKVFFSSIGNRKRLQNALLQSSCAELFRLIILQPSCTEFTTESVPSLCDSFRSCYGFLKSIVSVCYKVETESPFINHLSFWCVLNLIYP